MEAIDTTAKLAQARDQLALIETEHQIARLQSEQAAMQAAAHWQRLSSKYVQEQNLLEGWLDGFAPNYVDPATPFYDTPGFHGGAFNSQERLLDPEDTKDGRYRPFWDNHMQWRQLQGTLRWIAVGHPVGRNVIDTLCDFIVRNGYARMVRAKDRSDKSERTAAIVKLASDIIDEFHERTQFCGVWESDIVAATIGAGEKLIWIRHQGGGKAKIVDVPSEQVCELTDVDSRKIERAYQLPRLNWSFGIGTPLRDNTAPQAYFWNRDHSGQNYDVIPEHEAIFVKDNVPPQVKRGMSGFYPLLSILRILPASIVNVLVGGAIQSSIAYVRKMSTPSLGSSGSITELGSTGASARMIRGMGGQYESIMAKMYSPGEVHDTQGVDYYAGPMGNSQTPHYLQIIDSMMRIVGARYSMPEYLMSSIANTSNRSTSETTEQGWLRSIDRRQLRFSGVFHLVDRRVLDIACRAGRFAMFGIRTIDDLFSVVALVLTPPPSRTKDRSKETAADKILVDLKAMSKQTIAERSDVDWEEERERLEAEANDPLLNPPKPVMGLDDNPLPGQDTGFDARQAATEAALRDVRTSAEARAILESLTERDGCGANAPGGGGFQQGNTCGKGEGDQGLSGDSEGGVAVDDAPEIDLSEFESHFGGWDMDETAAMFPENFNELDEDEKIEAIWRATDAMRDKEIQDYCERNGYREGELYDAMGDDDRATNGTPDEVNDFLSEASDIIDAEREAVIQHKQDRTKIQQGVEKLHAVAASLGASVDDVYESRSSLSTYVTLGIGDDVIEVRFSDHQQVAGGGMNPNTGERMGESDISFVSESGEAGFDEEMLKSRLEELIQEVRSLQESVKRDKRFSHSIARRLNVWM